MAATEHLHINMRLMRWLMRIAGAIILLLMIGFAADQIRTAAPLDVAVLVAMILVTATCYVYCWRSEVAGGLTLAPLALLMSGLLFLASPSRGLLMTGLLGVPLFVVALGFVLCGWLPGRLPITRPLDGDERQDSLDTQVEAFLQGESTRRPH